MSPWATFPATCCINAISGRVQSCRSCTVESRMMPKAVAPSPTGSKDGGYRVELAGPLPQGLGDFESGSSRWSATARTSASAHSLLAVSIMAFSLSPSLAGSSGSPGRFHCARMLGTRSSRKVANHTWSTPRASPKPRTTWSEINCGSLVSPDRRGDIAEAFPQCFDFAAGTCALACTADQGLNPVDKFPGSHGTDDVVRYAPGLHFLEIHGFLGARISSMGTPGLRSPCAREFSATTTEGRVLLEMGGQEPRHPWQGKLESRCCKRGRRGRQAVMV